MTFGQGHDTPMGQGHQLWNIIQILQRRKKVKALTRCEQTDTQTGRFLYTPLNLFAAGITMMWNTCIIKIQHDRKGFGPGHRFLYMCTDLDLRDMTLGLVHDRPLGYGQKLCEILSRYNMAMKSYDPYTNFGCVHSDLDLGDMTLRERHDTPLGQGQQLCEISIFNKAVRSYSPDTDLGADG